MTLTPLARSSSTPFPGRLVGPGGSAWPVDQVRRYRLPVGDEHRAVRPEFRALNQDVPVGALRLGPNHGRGWRHDIRRVRVIRNPRATRRGHGLIPVITLNAAGWDNCTSARNQIKKAT